MPNLVTLMISFVALGIVFLTAPGLSPTTLSGDFEELLLPANLPTVVH